MQETWVQSLGGEDALEEGMAAHSSILAWRIPWTEEPGGVTVPGASESRTRLSDEHTQTLFHQGSVSISPTDSSRGRNGNQDGKDETS